MRTNRINPVTSSVFRQSKQYLHSNELVYKGMEKGEQFSRNPKKQKEKERQQEKKETGSNIVLKRNYKKMNIKEESFDGLSVQNLQNSLVKRSVNINKLCKRKAGIHHYKNSI